MFNFKTVRWDSLTFSGIVQQWSGIESVFYFFGGGGDVWKVHFVCPGSNDVINEVFFQVA